MTQMTCERSERLPASRAALEIVAAIRKKGTFERAVALVKECDVETAVIVIDNLDQLSAALILAWFHYEARFNDTYAQALVAKADELHIRGSLGVIYARDKVYRETGFFAGI